MTEKDFEKARAFEGTYYDFHERVCRYVASANYDIHHGRSSMIVLEDLLRDLENGERELGLKINQINEKYCKQP